MATEATNAAGQLVLTVEDDEAVLVCGPEGLSMYLHQDENGPLDTVANRTAIDMASSYSNIIEEVASEGDNHGTN